MKTVVPAEQLKDYIGSELGPSEWFAIDQARINAFADVTEDHQFIHVDKDKARATPFGDTNAHGFLTLSLLTHLTSDCSLMPKNTVMGVNYATTKGLSDEVHTGVQVPLLASGPGVSEWPVFQPQTELFHIMRKHLGLDNVEVDDDGRR